MPETFDIVIIGGGIVGASLAHAIGDRASVALIEREEAWGYHATGRSAAEFTLRFHSEDVGRLTRASADFLHHPPEGFCEVPLLRPRGNLLIAPVDKADHARAIFESESRATAAGQSRLEWLGRDRALEKVPFLDPDWMAAAIFDPDCWDVEVESLLQAYLKSARRKGATLVQRAELIGARFDAELWCLETTAGPIHARQVVNAAGGWADEVGALFGAPPIGLVPYRRTAISVKLPDYDLSGLPEVNEIDETFYFKPDAGQLMVSPADETPVDPHDAWAEEIDIAYAAHFLTESTTLDIHHIPHSWAGLRTFAADRLPVIGASGKVPGLFWLAGLGGYGIQTSPAVGRIAAALLMGDPIPADIAAYRITADMLSPARFER